MTTRKKIIPSIQVCTLPSCGDCRFAHTEENELICYVDPPRIIIHGAEPAGSVRGIEIDKDDHVCHRYIPRNLN